MLDDRQLLRRYAADGSETVFGELVARHVNLVYSAALRRTGGDAHLAQDITQLVFTDLARKARSLPENVVLAGWLHRATRYAAAQLLRAERRRAAREQEAVAMNTLASETAPDWAQIRPLLDEALDELNADDRDALILRFFEQRSLAEVGQALGANEDAARKRVTRALEKLRADLIRRGITTTAATLSAAISVNAVQSAPVGLAATLSTTAIAGTTLTAAATATKTIAMTTLQKTIIGATLAAAVGTGIYESRQASNARAETESLRQQQAPLNEQIQQLTRERDETTGKFAALRGEIERMNRDRSELLRLRGEVSRLRTEAQELAQTTGKKNDPAGTSMFEGIQWLPEWKDAGLSSPEATLETYFWAQVSGKVDKLREMMVFDHRTNTVPISEIYAKREVRQDGDIWRAATQGGVRIHRKFLPDGINADRAYFEVEFMGPHLEGGEKVAPNVIVGARATPRDPANPPAWSPNGSYEFELVRVDDQWKIVRDEARVRMAVDDEDSEAIAKMMMQMAPETLEKLKANPQLPARTLRAYEELKAESGK